MTNQDKKKMGEIFSKRLQEIIKEKGVSKEWILEKAKVSINDYNSIESGNIFSFDVYVIASIAYVLDISLDYLMGWSDEKIPSNQNEQLNEYDTNDPAQKAERNILHYLSLLNEDELNDVLLQIDRLTNHNNKKVEGGLIMFDNSINECREKANKTVAEVAIHLGIDAATYEKYEKNNEMPSINLWCRLMEFLDRNILPIRVRVSYPEEYKKELSETIDKYGNRTNNFKDNYDNAMKIYDCLLKLINYQDEALDLDEFLEIIPYDFLVKQILPIVESLTIVEIIEDPECTKLINRAFYSIYELNKPL